MLVTDRTVKIIITVKTIICLLTATYRIKWDIRVTTMDWTVALKSFRIGTSVVLNNTVLKYKGGLQQRNTVFLWLKICRFSFVCHNRCCQQTLKPSISCYFARNKKTALLQFLKNHLRWYDVCLLFTLCNRWFHNYLRPRSIAHINDESSKAFSRVRNDDVCFDKFLNIKVISI